MAPNSNVHKSQPVHFYVNNVWHMAFSLEKTWQERQYMKVNQSTFMFYNFWHMESFSLERTCLKAQYKKVNQFTFMFHNFEHYSL